MNSTTDPNLKSWIESANGSDTDFPIQNLPFGLFSRPGSDDRHIGIAIGEEILDCGALVESGHLDDHCSPAARCALSANSLNDYLGLGRDEWRSVRERVSALLRSDLFASL